MRLLLLCLLASLTTACVSTDLDFDLVLANEAKKVRAVQIGMTIEQVERVMGTEQLELSDRRHVYYTARPAKTDRFKAKDGQVVDIYY